MNAALQLFANAGDGIFAVDQEQRILFWSKLATQTLGYTTHDTLGQFCWNLLDGKSETGTPICRQNCPIIQQIRQNIPVNPFNLVVKHSNGQSIMINVSSIGLPSNGGEIFGLVHIQRETQ